MEDCGHLNARILDLALEIIYLLTGEDVDGCLEAQKDKDGDVLIEDQKTYKMFKKDEDEEVQYLEGHNDTMLENQLPLTSPDVSNVFSYRNPPERSTGSLYSQDCSQEDPSIPHHYQAELKSMKLEEEETYVRGEQKTAQSDEMEATKEERETCVKGNSRSTEEGVMLGTIKKEEEELKCWAGGDEVGSNTMEPLMSHPDDAAEDNGVTQCSAEEIYITVNTHHGVPVQLEERLTLVVRSPLRNQKLSPQLSMSHATKPIQEQNHIIWRDLLAHHIILHTRYIKD
ncbi:uncharacterized protein [Hyperolius riggenbachi]|uniref:uncharacterized protein isoform X3 n=1 Tax=Hyperolius riggenbachi TaxID=752182 RepID=UPI0035A288C0